MLKVFADSNEWSNSKVISANGIVKGSLEVEMPFKSAFKILERSTGA